MSSDPEEGSRIARTLADVEATVTDSAALTERSARETAAATEQAEHSAPGPETRRAAAAARQTEIHAEQTVADHQRAAEVAVAVAEQADELLLDEEARKVAARVGPDAPFGRPGRAGAGRGPLRQGFTLTAGGLLAVGLAVALQHVTHALLLLLVAAFVAVGLDPAVRWLVGRGLRRGLAVAVIAIGFVGAVAAFAAAAIPPLTRQLTSLRDGSLASVPQLTDTTTAVGRLNLKYHVADRFQTSLSQMGDTSPGGLLHVGTVLISATFDTVIVLVLIVYVLADLDKIKAAAYRLAPQHRRPRVGLLGDEVLNRIGGYVLGNVLTSLVAGVGNYVVLTVLGVPYALVLSVLVAVLDLIPLVGSTIGGVAVAVVALLGVSLTAAVITVVYHVLYRLLEDYVLNPRVLRRTVDVSPLVTIVAVVIGGGLLGIVGALVAVPAAAAIQLFLTEVVYPHRDAQDSAGDMELAPS